MDESTAAARQQVVEARAALLVEVDELGAATRSALDVPAKVRKNPVKFAAGTAGLTFLVVGGPQRTARRVVRTLRGGRTRPPKSVLPDEIERLVADLGGDSEQIRARLDREFADYLGSQKRAAGCATVPPTRSGVAPTSSARSSRPRSPASWPSASSPGTRGSSTRSRTRT